MKSVTISTKDNNYSLQNGENYKKTFYSGEIISINEVIKIYNYKNNINPELSIELFVNNSQKVKDNYELIKDLGINPDLKEIDKIIKDNYELVLSISHIDIPRLVASIIFTNMLIFFFDMLKKNEENFKYCEKIFKKICDISYYNFEIFINYCLVKNISTTSYINIFIRDIKNSMNDIEQKSLYIYILIQKYLYDIPLKLMNFPTNPTVFKSKRREFLNSIILKIKNEYNKILKYILKTQEYIIKIFKYYNYYFISYIDNSHKNLDYLREIISNLYKNIEKQHKKSIQAYNKAYKASEEYKKYKSPIFSQSISKLFTSRRISNYNSPIFSPSISIPSP